MITQINFNGPLTEVFRRTSLGGGIPFGLPSDSGLIGLYPEHLVRDPLVFIADIEVTTDQGVSWRKAVVDLDLRSNIIQVDMKGFGGRICRLLGTSMTLGRCQGVIVNAIASTNRG